MKIDTNTILIGVAALIVLGGGYWYFFAGSSDNAAPLTASGTAAPAAAQFSAVLGQLQPISFDTSIFSDPRFTGLVDLATPVTPEPAGRIDPFAPLPGGAKGK